MMSAEIREVGAEHGFILELLPEPDSSLKLVPVFHSTAPITTVNSDSHHFS